MKGLQHTTKNPEDQSNVGLKAPKTEQLNCGEWNYPVVINRILLLIKICFYFSVSPAQNLLPRHSGLFSHLSTLEQYICILCV